MDKTLMNKTSIQHTSIQHTSIQHTSIQGDLEFQINLERNTYNAGETVNGILFIKADKILKIRNLKFSVCGKERYEVYNDFYLIYHKEKYHTFFFEDLSSFLESINTLQHDGDGIEIPQGSITIPFHFSIPHDTLESYRGKVARIVYEVEIRADMGWKAEHRSMISFDVLNPNMKYTPGRPELEEHEKGEGKPYLGLELEGSNSNNSIPIFPAGGIIKGKLKVENYSMKRVKKAIIQLLGIERSNWEIGMERIKKKIKYDEDSKDNTIAFETQIPQNAERSYNGKYTEYYWILETKIDIAGSRDIHANKIIQVI